MLLHFLFLCLISLTISEKYPCECPNKDHCKNVDHWDRNEKEVVVASVQFPDYKLWMWDSFTTVIEWADAKHTDLMCYAHSKQKKYGFYLERFPQTLDATSHDVESYINVTREDIDLHKADVLALNLVDYLGNCSYAGEHVSGIFNVTTTVIKGIKNGLTTKVLCVMPWKPPCYDADCAINPALAEVCDGLILSPESYNTYCEETCTAKATVPYSKLMIGLTEYLASGFKPDQMLVGIPWHGYNYTCEKGDHMDTLTNHFVCHMKKKDNNGTMECDLEGSRRKVSIGSMVGDVPEMALLDATYSKADQAPWKTDIINESQVYMTWFEDIGSLMAKYDVVSKHSIRGAVIFTADDITYKGTQDRQFDDNMWSWLMHSVLSRGEVTTDKDKPNMAATAAGIGVGLFILGCIFGTLVSCIIFRKKKPLRVPFSQDPGLPDEYTDEDDDHHRPSNNVYRDHNNL